MGRTHEPLTEAVLTEGFFAGEIVDDPWGHLAALRAAGPVSWNEAGGYWIASHHAPAQQASVDPTRFCSGKGILTFEIGHEYPSPPTMMHTDPPDHTRYRQLVAPAFRPSAMRALEERLVGHVGRLLDDMPVGQQVDIMPALCVPFPLLVICELLGVPWEDWEKFFLWSEISIPGATDHSPEERLELQTEMFRYLLAAVAAKREAPADDVFSTVGTSGLTDVEIGMFAIQLLTAGNETVRNSLASGLVALANSPEQWQRLRDDRSLVPTAIEEILRWATPVIYFMRTAVADTELGGQAIAADDHVVLLYSSADRDESVFGPTAHTFDVSRSPNPHIAFGFGAHYCIGAALARQEISAVLNGLLDRNLDIAPTGGVELTRSAIIAGTRRAELTFTTR
jgi:cytochrome P450